MKARCLGHHLVPADPPLVARGKVLDRHRQVRTTARDVDLLRADGRNQHKKARARVVAAMKECDRDYPDDRAAHATCLKEIPGYKEHRVRPKF
ncbi:hypothetical protein LTR16_012248, partial [Cryomyces antarcticus]